MTNIKKILQNVSLNNDSYIHETFSDDYGQRIDVLAKPLQIGGTQHLFEANINTYPSKDLLHITVPLSETGFSGPDSGDYYQFLGELSACVNGNAKVVPYPWDNSNQPVIMLADNLSKIDEASLNKNLDYLTDVYTSVKPLHDLGISRLNVFPDNQARTNTKKYEDFTNIQNLLES
jgi:hypothetical protein